MKKQLQALGSNHAGLLKLKNGKKVNYGSIRIQNDNFVCYTGEGLSKVWPQPSTAESRELEKLDEGELMKLGYIAVLPISEITEIVK